MTGEEIANMIKKEHEYYIRFILLLLEAGIDLLREILEKALQKKGETLDQFLKSAEPALRNDRCLTQIQKDTLYPQNPQISSIKDFDITLLSHLLIKNLKAYIDNNEKQGVKDIRDLRNNYHAHAAEGKMNEATFRGEWNQLATIIRYTGNGLSPDVQKRHRDMIANIEKDQLDITAVAEQIKKLDQSIVFFQNIQTCLNGINKVQEEIVGAVEIVKTIAQNTDSTVKQIKESVQKSEVEMAGTHKDVLDTKEEVMQIKAMLVQSKEKRENQGRPTKDVNTVYGKLTIIADDQETVDKAEAVLLEASKNSIAKKEPSDINHKILQEKVTLAIEDIENKDVKVEDAKKGSIILEFKCLTLAAILELIDYYYSPSFKRRINEVAQALEDIIGKKICVKVVGIDRQSLQEVIIKMDKKDYEKVVQFELSCRGVDGLVHALEVFEEGKTVNSINELSNALSDAVGKPVTLHTSIDMNQMRKAINSIPDEHGYESQVSCTKGNDPLINPITTYQNMDLTQSGAKQDISEFESEDERIKNSRPSTYQQPSYRNLSFEADKDTKTSRTYKRLRSSEHGAPKSEYEETSYTQDYISRDLRTEGNIPTIIFEDEAGLTQSSARQNISDIESEDKLVKHLKSSTYKQPKKRKLLFKADEVAGPSGSCKYLP